MRVKGNHRQALRMLGHTFPDERPATDEELEEIRELVEDIEIAAVIEERLSRGGETIPLRVLLRDFIADGLITEEEGAHILYEQLSPEQEAERMSNHPGIVFHDGPTGRRASLDEGPDVWEVIACWQDQPQGTPAVAGAAKWLALPTEKVRLAMAYYGDHPHDVDARIASNKRWGGK